MNLIKLTQTFRRGLTALFVGALLASCSGGGSPENSPPATSAPANSSGTAVVQGLLSLPSSSAESPADYAVYNSFQSVTPTANGSLSIEVSQTGLTVTYAALKSGKKVYSATTTGAVGPININARSTAETLVLLNPLLIPDSIEEQARIISQVRSDSAVSALASVIETVYGSVEDPLSDARVLEAARDAVLSVLGSLSASTINSASTASSTTVASAISKSLQSALSTGMPTALSVNSSMVIREGDMGALDLKTSSGNTLRLVPNVVGRWGIKVKTNVDWVAEIIELDSSKIVWGGGSPILPTAPLTTNELDNLAKTNGCLINGCRKKVIVNGEIAAGALGFVVDPLGTVFGAFGEIIDGVVFPKDGFTLPGDGVYAIVALSGSPFGDSVEYDSVKNSPWQLALWEEAMAINAIAAALDVVDVGVTIASAGTGGTEQLKSAIRATYPLILTKIQLANNHGTAFFTETISFAIGKLIESLSTPHSGVESAGIKATLGAALNIAKSTLDVWSGSISASSRLLNLGFNVTPKEVGYVVVGAPNTVADQTAPSVPTGVTAALVSSTRVSLAWNASTDNVSVAGYRLYRNGMFQGTEASTSRYDTVLSGGTQYCYEISAYDATGNESTRSSARCVTQTQAAPPATPGSFTASPQSQGSIALGWLDNSDNETGFKIERKVGTGGSFVQIAAIGPLSGIGSVGYYKDSDLVAGTTYCYRLRAYNLMGDSPFTVENCTTAQASTLPIPGSFILSNNSPVCDLNPPSASPAVRLNWISASGSTSYGVYRDGAPYSSNATTGTTYYNSANLVAGQSYTYKIIAKNASGITESNTITVSIPANICPAAPPSSTVTCTPPQVLTNGVCVTPPTNTFSISGSAGLQGVTMTLSGANSGGAMTDANGNYTFGNLANGSYTVAPALSGYSFTPTSRVITVSGGNITAANFTATIQSGTLYSITGTVTLSGYVLPGVTVTLSGSNSGVFTTGTNGMFAFALLPNGSYTITPALSGYTFTPASSQITINGSNFMGANFTASAPTTLTVPAVQSLAATSVTSTSAQLNASINPNGSSTTTYFEYGTTTSYGSTTGVGGSFSGTSAAAINYSMSGLSPNTTYHYRVVATNSGGTSRGGDVTFTTLTATSAACTENEPNDSSLYANPLTLGVGCTGNIATSTDKDWFDIYVSSGTTITFYLQVPAGLDYDMALYGPTNTNLSQHWLVDGNLYGAGQPETITYTTTATGYFSVQIYGYAGAFSPSSTYTITRTK